MKTFRILFLPTFLILLTPVNHLFAQAIKSNDIPVEDPSKHRLTSAWTGGWNAPRFSPIDLNLDGTKDLFVFDMEGDRVMTFINKGTAGKVDYEYAPQYEKLFPEMFYWALLVDYNNDGKEDIFTYNDGGIRVFKNISTTSTGLAFELKVDPYLVSHYDQHTSGNLYCSSSDIPAIADIDGDGDLDILTFGAPSAQSVYFHENFAADSSDPESFKMYINTYCWGKFEEAALTNSVTLNLPCPKSAGREKHSGSTLLAFDPDHNQLFDLVLGDISYSTMLYLTNGGSVPVANMIAQTTDFPNASNPVDLPLFPAAYYLDVNNDNLKDLLVSPNALYNIEDVNSVWYYKNVGTASRDSFVLVDKHFLQNDMIDVGTGALPVFFDYEPDGQWDLVVGNYGRYNGALDAISGLQFLHGIGSSSEPRFLLSTNNFAGLDSLPLNTTLNIPTSALNVTFGDLTGDGFKEMIVGDANGKLHFFLNEKVGEYREFKLIKADYKNIDVGQNAAPQLFDLDRDGKLDLIIGEQDGNLNYYRNIGTKQFPDFKLITEKLGNVDTRGTDYYGNSQPLFFRRDDQYFLLCGTDKGRIYYYTDIDNNLAGSFTLADDHFQGIDAGRKAKPAIADLNHDGFYELLVGNFGGGIALYNTQITVGLEDVLHQSTAPLDFDLIPMDGGKVKVVLRGSQAQYRQAELNIRNMLGQQIFTGNFTSATTVSTEGWTPGMWFFTVKSSSNLLTKKLVLQK